METVTDLTDLSLARQKVEEARQRLMELHQFGNLIGKSRMMERVGESKPIQVDIRIIAATNKNLMDLVSRGLFREDLYYRLKVFPITIPPLRERKKDIPLLIAHFIRRFNRKTGKSIQAPSPDALRIIMDYWWPGNVRELENAIEHAFVLCNTETIHPADLPVEIRRAENPAPVIAASGVLYAGKEISRERLMAELQACGWNKAEAGRRLGKSRTSIWKYMKKFDIPMNPPK